MKLELYRCSSLPVKEKLGETFRGKASGRQASECRQMFSPVWCSLERGDLLAQGDLPGARC